MSRPHHYKEYSDLPEIAPGVFISLGTAVYIVDDEGEVCSWNIDEWLDDRESITAAITAVTIACMKGSSAVRQNIADRGATLRQLIKEVENVSSR